MYKPGITDLSPVFIHFIYSLLNGIIYIFGIRSIYSYIGQII